MSAKHLVAAALLVAAPLAHAGTVSIVNNCAFKVYVTPSQLGTDSAIECTEPGDTWSAPISGEAVDLKVMTKEAFCVDDCVQLEYSVAGPDLFYDLSNINAKGMDGFVDYGLSVENSDPAAPQVDCPPGKDQCTKGVYNEWWQNEATFCSKKDADLTMHLCLANKGGYSTANTAAPAPAPKKPESAPKKPESAPKQEEIPHIPAPVVPEAPKTTLAPSYVAPKESVQTNVHAANLIGENEDGSLNLQAHVVMVTDIVTETVFVKRSEATAAAAPVERRHIHRHAHAHGHSA